ncbi:MAG: dihydroorotate dehydrogenase electron transfer subunit [Eubacterium sp.]|nr:dihydroorotate dehydrogenase electron transfer subunit [Eubacterium sp.]
MKRKETAAILRQERISDGIYDMLLEAPEIARDAVPGQFVNVFLHDKSRLLPRPISLCEIDPVRNTLRLVYRAAGAGTTEMSRMKAGDSLQLMGPLGNGFPLEEAAGRHVYLIGGGIGIPPMLETAKALSGSAALAEEQRDVINDEERVSGKSDGVNARIRDTIVTSVLGYRRDCFLKDEFDHFGETLVATEDGSTGTRGTVLDAICQDGRKPDVIFACGPLPMLRALKHWAEENNVPCWVSMEERMACGIGACLACVCQTKDVDGHSHVRNARVCKDGPVFNASRLDL